MTTTLIGLNAALEGDSFFEDDLQEPRASSAIVQQHTMDARLVPYCMGLFSKVQTLIAVSMITLKCFRSANTAHLRDHHDISGARSGIVVAKSLSPLAFGRRIYRWFERRYLPDGIGSFFR